jgi:hypothetical protein
MPDVLNRIEFCEQRTSGYLTRADSRPIVCFTVGNDTHDVRVMQFNTLLRITCAP